MDGDVAWLHVERNEIVRFFYLDIEDIMSTSLHRIIETSYPKWLIKLCILLDTVDRNVEIYVNVKKSKK